MPSHNQHNYKSSHNLLPQDLIDAFNNLLNMNNDDGWRQIPQARKSLYWDDYMNILHFIDEL